MQNVRKGVNQRANGHAKTVINNEGKKIGGQTGNIKKVESGQRTAAAVFRKQKNL